MAGDGGATEAAAAFAPARRPPWVWPSVAARLLLFGFFAASLGGVFKVKTPDGLIVLENVPKDAEILVDGSTITFTWPGAGKPLEIRAVPGQRKVEVKRDGFKTFGEVVTVKTDESEEITVRLEPLVVARPGKEPVPSAVRPGWTSLFNGKDLTGWTVDSGTRRLACRRGQPRRHRVGRLASKSGFLLSDRDFSDFHLRFEYQPSPGSNSGVTFRALPGEFAGRLAHPLQVELVDRDESVKNGSFYLVDERSNQRHAPPELAGPVEAGRLVEHGGDRGAGRLAPRVGQREGCPDHGPGQARGAAGANPALKRRSGRIGFQSHTGTVRFRNIEIKELAGTAKMAAITEPPAFVVLGGKGVAEAQVRHPDRGRAGRAATATRSRSAAMGRLSPSQSIVGHSLTIRAAGRLSPRDPAQPGRLGYTCRLDQPAIRRWCSKAWSYGGHV